MTNNHGTGHDLPLTLTHLRLAVEEATKYLEADRPAGYDDGSGRQLRHLLPCPDARPYKGGDGVPR